MAKTVFILGVFLILMSCKKQDSYTSDLGYSYFPIEEGHFIEYKVLRIDHDQVLFPPVDSTEYYLKTVVGEKILSNTGDSVNKLFFYVKPHLDSTYTLDKVNTIYNDGYRGVYNLDNQKYVKLSFPAEVSRVWDMNILNTEDELRSRITHLDFAGLVNGTAFNQLMRTQQLDFFSLVDYQKAHEIYAKDIGLVQIYFKDLVIQNFDTTDISYGTEIYWDYLSHGVE